MEGEVKARERGMFVVFEGADGCGKTTQISRLAGYVKKHHKYQELVLAREPTKKADEIRRRLKEDLDAYAGADEFATLYFDDRIGHTARVLIPNLDNGLLVLCDRYSMSTCAYQWAQGATIQSLIKMHKHKDILVPDITFFLDIDLETAIRRVHGRGGDKDKFERDKRFVEDVIYKYRALVKDERYEDVFGKVVTIDGARSEDEVASDIEREFRKVYNSPLINS